MYRYHDLSTKCSSFYINVVLHNYPRIKELIQWRFFSKLIALPIVYFSYCYCCKIAVISRRFLTCNFQRHLKIIYKCNRTDNFSLNILYIESMRVMNRKIDNLCITRGPQISLKGNKMKYNNNILLYNTWSSAQQRSISYSSINQE